MKYFLISQDTAWKLEIAINEHAEKGMKLICAYATFSLNSGNKHYAFMERIQQQPSEGSGQ